MLKVLLFFFVRLEIAKVEYSKSSESPVQASRKRMEWTPRDFKVWERESSEEEGSMEGMAAIIKEEGGREEIIEEAREAEEPQSTRKLEAAGGGTCEGDVIR